MALGGVYHEVRPDLTATVLRADATLTGSYVAYPTTFVSPNTLAVGGLDLLSYDSCTVAIIIGTAQAGKTCNVKFLWSMDNITFIPEKVLVAGTAATGDQPLTPYDKRVDVPMDSNTVHYIERVKRLARYLQVEVKSDVVTTGTVSIVAVPATNSN